MKRVISVAVSLVFVAGALSGPAHSSWMPEGFNGPSSSGGNWFGIDDTHFGMKSSHVTSGTSNLAGGPDFIRCITFEGECSLAKSNSRFLDAQLQLGLCDSDGEVDCVRSLTIDGKSGNLEVLEGEYVPNHPESGLPEGKGPILLTLENSLYLLSLRVHYTYNRSGDYFQPQSMESFVIPAKRLAGEGYSGYKVTEPVVGSSRRIGETGQGNNCLWLTPGTCYQADLTGWTGGTRIGLELELSKRWGAFFKGRLSDPFIDVKTTANSQIVNLSAAPSLTHKVFFPFDPGALTEAQKKAFCFGSSWCELPQPGVGGLSTHRSDSERSMAMIQAFTANHKDTSAAEVLEWSFGVAQEGKNQCFAKSKGLTGLVTSNAPAYQAGPPTLSNGYLGYKVAGLHYQSDGKTLNLGTYNLQLRSDVARCLYGFTSAPVYASVQVLSDDGKVVPAVTTVTEKDGWIRLSASGFTFSEKQVRTALTQPLALTIPKFPGRTTFINGAHQQQIRGFVARSKSNSKFICTGTYVKPADKTLALQRARAACNYAKTLNKNFSFFAQAKITKAASYDGRVMVTSK